MRMLMVIFGAILVFTNLALGYNLEEYYPLAEGNSWTYLATRDKGTLEKVIKVQGTELVNGLQTKKIGPAENEYKCIRIEQDGIKEYKNLDEDISVNFIPARPIFPNIEMGEARAYSVNFLIYNNKSIEIDKGSDRGRCSLQAVEDLDVPLGRFTACLRFLSTSDWQPLDSLSVKSSCTFWLAPGVGVVKRVCVSAEYSPETNSESTSVKIDELVSAVIDGKEITAR